MNNAADFLAFGDALRARADKDNVPVATLASELGTSSGVATKAWWLAGAYPAASRSAIGRRALSVLAASHLEAAALAPPDHRAGLLRQAAATSMSVRELRAMARLGSPPASPGSGAVSGGDDLARSTRALSAYLDFSDDQLARLLSGPKGKTITDLASAGAELSVRIGACAA